MAVKLIANYAKKLGLPGYSSHQFSISVEIELTNVEDIAATSERFYRQLQDSVDKEMLNYGFVPPDGYGMANGARVNGSAAPSEGSSGPANGSNGRSRGFERWRCTDGQKGFILRLVNENNLNKEEVEALAQQLFGGGVKELDKMQASQLIEELLEKTGKSTNGRRPAFRREEVQR